MFQLEGIYAPIPTPMAGDAVAYDKLAENMKFWNDSALSGVVVMGSNGEFVFLNPEEKRTLIKEAVSLATKDKHVIAGTGCESTCETIKLCEAAADCGAEAVLVISPNYYKKAMAADRVIYAFYEEVADRSPLPVILYNMPGNSGINLSASVVASLAGHKNIIGVKDSSGNIVQIMEIIRDTPSDFSVFAGSASFLFPAAAAGAKGGTLALANVFPNECAKLYDLTKAGQTNKAAALQLALIKANTYVTGKYGIPGLKAAMEHMGCFGGEPRKPLLPLNEDGRRDLYDVLDKTKAAAAAIIG